MNEDIEVKLGTNIRLISATDAKYEDLLVYGWL